METNLKLNDMKKFFLLACVVLSLAAVSCDKSKTCRCTVTQTNPGGGAPIVTTQTGTIEKGECEDMNATQTMNIPGDDDFEPATMTQTSVCEEI